MKTMAMTKTYNRRIVLDLPELELPEGQITAVIGANGSGKSTFAKILGGIDRPDAPHPVLPEISAGYLPQKSFPFRMSVEKNILSNGHDRSRAAELMTALGLGNLAAQSAKKLSGGETARMALARLLMKQYELLILDEPTAAMDMESTLLSENLISHYCQETGCAVLLITHSIQQARRLARQVLFLQQGKLIEQGDTDTVLSKPARAETKQFLEFYGI